MSKQMHVFGGFKTPEGAQLAANKLFDAGVPTQSVSVLISEEAREHLATIERHTKAAEGAATGGIAGGVFGALVAGLATVAAVAAPGVGLLAAGPLVSALAGAGVGAAAGGAIGGLAGLGMTEEELKRYSNILANKGVLVCVSTDDKQVREAAKKTLSDAGAISIDVSKGETARI